ncbi:MAG: hypothetical protein ACRD1K_18380 [Acidimicrobiales bacterium]
MCPTYRAVRRRNHFRASDDLRAARADSPLGAVATTRLVFYPFEPFARRVWEFRDNLTVHDAWYVALTEALDSDLVTADNRLVGSPGPIGRVRLAGQPA